MANLIAIPRLTDAHLALTPITPQFTQITLDTLGVHGTSDDGVDDLIAIPALAIDDDIDSIPQLDQHLLDADFVEGEFAGASWTPIAGDLAPFGQSGDSILGAFSDAVVPADPGTGGTGAPPPDTSGGAGGSGGDGGGGSVKILAPPGDAQPGEEATVNCDFRVGRDGHGVLVCR